MTDKKTLTLVSHDEAEILIDHELAGGWPADPPESGYRIVAFKRNDKHLSSYVSAVSDGSSVPDAISALPTDGTYFVVVAAYGLDYATPPEEKFHDFLADNGAGIGLANLEQKITDAGYALRSKLNYALASVLGTDQGYEAYSLNDPVVLALELDKFGGLWTPVSLTQA